MGTNRCSGCEAGWTDEDGHGCSCEEQGPIPWWEQIRELATRWASPEHAELPEDLVFDSCDFFDSIGNPDATEAQTEDVDAILIVALRMSQTEACDACGGTGKDWSDNSDDDLPRSEPCRHCDARGKRVETMPRLIVQDGRLCCCGCGDDVNQHDVGCPRCGADFPIVPMLRASVDPVNDSGVTQMRRVH